MSKRTVGNGHIDSADIGKEVLILVGGGGTGADAMSEAEGLGDAVGEAAAAGDPETEAQSFCFLMASAWRFGGPRRRLGRS